MLIVLGVIYFLVMLVFTVAFLITWISSRKEIRKYAKYGVVAGLIVLGFDAAAFFISPIALDAWWAIVILLADAYAFARTAGFTMVGMHYCAVMGYPSFPFLLRRFKIRDSSKTDSSTTLSESGVLPTAHATPGQPHESSQSPIEQGSQGYVPLQEPSPDSPLAFEPNPKACVLSALAVVGISVIYSLILFAITSPRASEVVRTLFGEPTVRASNAITPRAIMLLFVSAFGEEIIFRLGIQSFMAKTLSWQNRRYGLAIPFTALLWTVGHVGVLEPGWVKAAQIFPIGLMLGWLLRRYGAESCILAHGLFNILFAYPSSRLIR